MKIKIGIVALLIFSVVGCKNNEKLHTEIPQGGQKRTSLEKLTTGNQRFLDEKSIHPHQNKKTVLENQDGQKPFVVIITCSDGRVSPEIVFDQGIGDLFDIVLKNTFHKLMTLALTPHANWFS